MVPISISEMIESYKKAMNKMKINTLNETYYYTLLIKLSLNQHGKTWRETLQYEKKVIFINQYFYISIFIRKIYKN